MMLYGIECWLIIHKNEYSKNKNVKIDKQEYGKMESKIRKPV